MGVSGLLPLLKSIHKHKNLKAYTGQTLGIDGFGWLHRGAIACAVALAFDKPTTKYLEFVIKRVNMLLDFGITPYLVFDGDAVPSKAGTNAERKQKREEAKAQGLALYRSGKTQQAFQELQKGVSITPQMTHRLIEELRRLNVPYLVAPYEADAQLAYLEQKGIIDAIISEDSDLLVFGAKTLITKLDEHGNCVEINRVDFNLCKDISLAGWTDSMFRRMAILSGCDYLPNVNRMGLKTAHTYIRKYKEANKAIHMMAMSGSFSIPADYIQRFRDAELAFLHHRVFCPDAKRLVNLNEIPPALRSEPMPFLGEDVEPDVAIGVAYGDLNPKTKEPFVSASQGVSRAILGSRPNGARPLQDLKARKSIDSFFKPNRTPLAELDPNSLTPTSSQRQLLERHRNASWEPRAVQSAPQLRRTMTDIYSPITPTSATSHRSSWMSLASAKSTYQPLKRPRLCSNIEVSPSKEIKRSPFFGGNGLDMSPSALKKTRDRQKKKPGFDVWSDDTTEEVLQQLQRHEAEQDLAAEKLDLFDDHRKQSTKEVPPSSPSPQNDVEESQSSNGTNQLGQLELNSREQSFTSEQVTAVTSEDKSEEFTDLLEYHVQTINQKFKDTAPERTFSAQSSERRLQALRSLSAAAIPNKDDEPAPSSVCHHVEQGASEVELSKTSISALAQTFVYQSPERQVAAFASLGREKLETSTVSEVHNTVLASPQQTPQAQHRTVTGSGSEDMLIPSSPGDISEVDQRSPKPKFDLKAFKFVGSH